MDEHDVDVADVVQLAAARLAHRDDGEPVLGQLVGQAGAGHGQARGQGRRGEVGQLGRGLVHAHRPGQVAGGQREHAAAVLRAQPRQHLGPAPLGPPDAVRSRQVRPDRAEQPGLQAEQGGAGARHGVVGEVAPVVGVRGQVVAEGRARAEDRQQPGPQPLVVAQGRQHVGRPRLDQALERRHGEVGVGGVGQRRDQSRVDGPAVVPQPEDPQRPLRGRRLGEPEADDGADPGAAAAGDGHGGADRSSA